MAESVARSEPGTKDRWIPSTCSLCYGTCSILGHRVNGTLVKIEGNPKSSYGMGRLCAKGVSGIMTLYDPNRVNVPLRRTNPKKGPGIDPGWKEISWEEALSEIAERLRKIHQDDPRKLFMQRTTTNTSGRTPLAIFAWGFGTPNLWVAGGGLHCGNGAHLIGGIFHASWSLVPDFKYCNYAIYFGASKGHGAGHASCTNIQLAAEARERGMKLVVVDPMCNFASAKASQWVPIRVGTDGALALAMANVIVNEMGVYDAPYLKQCTNAPYLVGPEKTYVRDAESRKPLVWDGTRRKAVPYDDPEMGDFALEGTFEVNGVSCRPAFAALREHLKQFTPSWAAEISTVSEKTIREMAQEFATEARVGSTIVIEGKTYPYRPAAAIYFRGSEGHVNSVYNCYAIGLLNHLVGAADVVGGALGFNPVCHGHPETGRPHYVPKPGPDGLMVTGTWLSPHLPYPFADPSMPEAMGLQELFPLGMVSPFTASRDQEEMWQRFQLPYRPEAMINYGCNSVMSVGNKDTVIETLLKIPFIVSFDIYHTEFTEFADIVLPDTSYLEHLDSRPNPFILNLHAGLGEWCWPIKQPVVPPTGERRSTFDVLIELADRIGIREETNLAFNSYLKLEAPYRLESNKKYAYEEICDRDLKTLFGEKRGLEWFKKEGLISWKKKPEEVYWRYEVPVRIPIYWEFLKPLGEKAGAIARAHGMEWDDTFYDPLPTWKPCPSHECHDSQYDLYGFYYRDTLHTNSFTMENPWLDEAARIDPFSYTIAMNKETGLKKGLRDGEQVWVESEKGRKVRGKLHLTEAMHPEGLGFGGCAGHWSKKLPVAQGKGVFFNELLEIDFEHSSPVNLNLDLCVKVRVYR